MNIREIIEGTLLNHWIILAFFMIAFLTQLGIYLFVFLKVPLYTKTKKSGEKDFFPGLSVIICAKNEEQNLRHYLPHVLQQDYPEFEVVVVNDSSTDESEQVLMELAQEFRQLRYTSIPVDEKLQRGKKLALTIGLKSARYAHVVLTDADCYPVSNHWLKRMAANFSDKHKIVLGCGRYEREKGLLNTLIRYETTFTAIQYLSYAIKGKPYMGVGRNLAYEKTLFFENKGFSGHYHLLSGDDDLFVNANATGRNCVVEFSPESHTLSRPESTFRDWIKQKKRHLSVGQYYKIGSRVRLASEWISRITLYTTLIWICISLPWRIIACPLFGLLLITRLVVFKLGMQRLDEKNLLLPSLLLDPVFPVFMGTIWFSGLFEHKYQTWR
jgi:cellulose synthase/poly-beta-1,6-N-acetylglucosamine synthase-like glycosyltransferase